MNDLILSLAKKYAEKMCHGRPYTVDEFSCLENGFLTGFEVAESSYRELCSRLIDYLWDDEAKYFEEFHDTELQGNLKNSPELLKQWIAWCEECGYENTCFYYLMKLKQLTDNEAI